MPAFSLFQAFQFDVYKEIFGDSRTSQAIKLQNLGNNKLLTEQKWSILKTELSNLPGFKLIDGFDSKTGYYEPVGVKKYGGFAAAAYINNKNQIIISFRGTEPDALLKGDPAGDSPPKVDPVKTRESDHIISV